MGNRLSNCAGGEDGAERAAGSNMQAVGQVEDIDWAPLKEEPGVQILRDVDLVVLDNSLRETTVAALRGHTPDTKFAILDEVRKCGFRHTIIGALSPSKRVDDRFCQQLKDRGDNFDNFFAFSESYDNLMGDVWDPALPAGLRKMKEFGIRNPIVELDLCCRRTDYIKLDLNAFIKTRLQWIAEELSAPDCPSRIVINIRDCCQAARECPERIVTLVRFLAALPEPLRPWALITEEPTGEELPHMFGQIIARLRKLWPKRVGFEAGGHILVHVHRAFGLSESCIIRAIMEGADGIWCAIPMDGAVVGHAGSALTIANLVRYGNRSVLDTYDCRYLRKAAANITKLVTGDLPDISVEFYGPRSVDSVFDFPGMGGGCDFSQLLSTARQTRIHGLSTPKQMGDRLTECFGEPEEPWNERVLGRMLKLMEEDMLNGQRLDYFCGVGIALLYRRAGGRLSEGVWAKLTTVADSENTLIQQVRDVWVAEEEEDQDGLERMSHRDFYDVFMARVFGCTRCDVTEAAMGILDNDRNGWIEWPEFKIWLLWAVQQYPDKAKTPEDVVDCAMRYGIFEFVNHFCKEAKLGDPTLDGVNNFSFTSEGLVSLASSASVVV